MKYKNQNNGKPKDEPLRFKLSPLLAKEVTDSINVNRTLKGRGRKAFYVRMAITNLKALYLSTKRHI